MSPLNLERLNPQTKEWELLPSVQRGAVSGPMQSYLPNGSSEVYIFHCNGNNTISTIYKSAAEAKTDSKGRIKSFEIGPLAKYRELRNGQSVEIEIKPGLRKRPETIKLTHT